MKKVFISKIQNYNLKEIIDFLEKSFPVEKLKDKVLIKPNLLSNKAPDKCVNTHPLFFEAVVKFLKNYNLEIFVGDSPGFGTLKGNLKSSSYIDIIKKYGVKIFEFKKRIEVENKKNKILKKYKISDAINFEYIINLAKLKTHCMMGLTLSVKNCYGFIVGKDKLTYHLKAGHNKIYFANILIDIYETVKPDINIIDGIWGMEGNGPSSGDPANFKIVGLSECGYSLDYVIENLVHYGLTLITSQAIKRNLFQPENIDIKFLNEKPIYRIKPSKVKPANFYLPKFITNFLYSAPKINQEKCIKCYTCLNSCPVGAIFEKDKLKIDKNKCIRCYCCHELCMYDAVKI